MEKAQLPRHRDRAPDGSLVCALSSDCLVLFLAALSALRLAGGMVMQAEEGARQLSGLSICSEGWLGHRTVLQDTVDPSCLQTDLICKAAI